MEAVEIATRHSLPASNFCMTSHAMSNNEIKTKIFQGNCGVDGIVIPSLLQDLGRDEILESADEGLVDFKPWKPVTRCWMLDPSLQKRVHAICACGVQ